MKDIPKYEGLYAITKDGRVWSYPKSWNGHSHNGMWLKSRAAFTGGYPAVTLHKNIAGPRKSKSIAIHRLLALTYLPNPDNLPQVHHIDFNKKNYAIDNLKWVTRSENTMYSAKVGQYSRNGEQNGRYKYSMPLRNKLAGLRELGLSYQQIGDLFNIPQSSTIKIIKEFKEGD